jgi:hypothetical protein
MMDISVLLILLVLIALVWAIRKVSDTLLKINDTLVRLTPEKQRDDRH